MAAGGKDAALEAVMTQLGEFGTYQFRQHIYHLLAAFLAGVHMLSFTFTAPTPDHRCEVPDIDLYKNHTDIEHYIPFDTEKEQYDSCQIFKVPGNPDGGSIPCHGPYVFNTTYYGSSKVIDFGLVCDKRWMRALLQSIYMLGVLCGGVTMGGLADSFGRKPVLYTSAILQLVFAVICAFAPSYYVYAVAQFFLGAFGSGGAYVTGFVLSMELIGPSKRTICGTAFSFVFAVGVMLDSFWGWLIPNNVQILQLVFAAHSLLMVGHIWLVDESIRWLWGKGRTKEALEIASKAIEINGRYFVRHDLQGKQSQATQTQNDEEDDSESQNDLESQTNGPTIATDTTISIISGTRTGSTRNGDGDGEAPGNQHPHPPHAGFIDVLRLPNLRFRAISMAYLWFANSLVYYGLAFNIGTLPGNPFLMTFLNGLAEVPGYIIVWLLLDRLGRRCCESVLLLIGGTACVVIAFFSHGAIVIAIAMLAKIAAAGSFAICYNYTAELFPTVIRNSIVGITTMAARGAGMLAPEIILLDEFGKALPTIIFGSVALFAAFFSLFLPETMNKEMPQTIDDGEHFGKGDTAFHTLWKCYKKRKTNQDGRERLE